MQSIFIFHLEKCQYPEPEDFPPEMIIDEFEKVDFHEKIKPR